MRAVMSDDEATPAKKYLVSPIAQRVFRSAQPSSLRPSARAAATAYSCDTASFSYACVAVVPSALAPEKLSKKLMKLIKKCAP